jgi:hypothetical protein
VDVVSTAAIVTTMRVQSPVSRSAIERRRCLTVAWVVYITGSLKNFKSGEARREWK